MEGLQKGVGELESEAVGWRGALEAARSRLAAEEERGRTERLAVQAEVARLGREAERRRAEAEEEKARLEGLRARCRAEGERRAQEAREAAVELEGLRSEAAGVRSRLEAEQAELQATSAAVEDKLASGDEAEAAALSLDRRAAELRVQVEDLEAARDRAAAEAEAARRRQTEELSRWKEATEERRQEFDKFSGLVRDKAAALSDLEEQVRGLHEQVVSLEKCEFAREVTPVLGGVLVGAVFSPGLLWCTNTKRLEMMEMALSRRGRCLPMVPEGGGILKLWRKYHVCPCS